MSTRVIFWSELFWPYMGGAEIFGANLVAALRERNYEIVVVTRQDSEKLPQEDQYHGIPIFRLPFYGGMTTANAEQILLARQRLAQLKRTFAPDLVHVHGFGLSAFFYIETARVCPAPLLVTLVVDLADPSHKHEMLNRLLSSAQWVTGKSATVLAQARQLVPQIGDRSSVIYNGLAAPSLAPAPLPLAPPRLLCLGRLKLQKGFDLALTAMTLIHRRFPAVRLIIAGDGDDRMQLEHQAAELGLSQVVDFLGWVAPHQVFELINTATIVLMPSRWEGLPSVALQAGMMARPIVGTRVSGISDVVAHQHTGLLVERDDASGMADAVTALLDQPDIAIQMGKAARRRVSEVFDWEKCVNAYDALWRRLTAPHSHDRQLNLLP